jgi:hypothetical protein
VKAEQSRSLVAEVRPDLNVFHSGVLMRNLLAMAAGTAALLSSGALLAQNGTMMNGTGPGNGWMNGYSGMGGYGGILVPILLTAVVVGLVVWVVTRTTKKGN